LTELISWLVPAKYEKFLLALMAIKANFSRFYIYLYIYIFIYLYIYIFIYLWFFLKKFEIIEQMFLNIWFFETWCNYIYFSTKNLSWYNNKTSLFILEQKDYWIIEIYSHEF
jgi:hypothetical protein